MCGSYPLLLSPDDTKSGLAASDGNGTEDPTSPDATTDQPTERTRHSNDVSAALVMWFALQGGC